MPGAYVPNIQFFLFVCLKKSENFSQSTLKKNNFCKKKSGLIRSQTTLNLKGIERDFSIFFFPLK